MTEARGDAIRAVETVRGRRLISYVTGDRQPITANIGDDAVRPIFDVLDAIGKVTDLDLFIYSRGGALEVPWRIASALRQHADTWNILVPFRANSAATLLALGADDIVLGPHGELGPIDPILTIQRLQGAPGQTTTPVQEQINVEDVMAYLRFVGDEVGLTDQSALAQGLGRLAERLDAVGLGSVYRTRTHIRDVARRMLTSKREPPTERVMETIVETLAERVYAHGHAIGLGEARDIGLSVTSATPEEAGAMWQLLEAYERDLSLRQPIDPLMKVATVDHHDEPVAIAVVESTEASMVFRASFEVQAQRTMPPTLNVTLNLPPLPAGIRPEDVAALQGVLQQMGQALFPMAQQAVQDALRAQAPLAGAEVSLRGAAWQPDVVATSDGDPDDQSGGNG